ncbi:MAG: methyltransferase domain-containing protein [Pseudomonadota bacterium]
MSVPFYRAFEDRYRGARDVIKQRLRAYTPFLAPMAAQWPGAAALDLGCGRGEWLELLGEHGFAAHGVDLDDDMLAACRERGLAVETADALAALRARPDASLALVSAFHLVEHIGFEQVQQLIAEALRALRPGGLLILETPNPENLVVGASSFYMDPSHLRPLPPPLLAFAAEHAGYGRHKVVRLQEQPQLHTDAPLGLINVLEGPSPDYAVVAQKSAAPAALAPFDAAFEAEYGIALAPLAVRYETQLADDRGVVHRALARLDQDQARLHLGLAEQHALAARTADALGQAEHRLGLLEQRVAQAEARADALGQRVIDLLSSRSWRITAPLRAASVLASRTRGAVRDTLKRVLRRSARAVLSQPWLAHPARLLLRLTPGLRTRLYALLLQANGATPAALAEADAPGQLSPRAARIYHTLSKLQRQRAAGATSKE